MRITIDMKPLFDLAHQVLDAGSRLARERSEVAVANAREELERRRFEEERQRMLAREDAEWRATCSLRAQLAAALAEHVREKLRSRRVRAVA